MTWEVPQIFPVKLLHPEHKATAFRAQGGSRGGAGRGSPAPRTQHSGRAGRPGPACGPRAAPAPPGAAAAAGRTRRGPAPRYPRFTAAAEQGSGGERPPRRVSPRSLRLPRLPGGLWRARGTPRRGPPRRPTGAPRPRAARSARRSRRRGAARPGPAAARTPELSRPEERRVRSPAVRGTGTGPGSSGTSNATAGVRPARPCRVRRDGAGGAAQPRRALGAADAFENASRSRLH